MPVNIREDSSPQSYLAQNKMFKRKLEALDYLKRDSFNVCSSSDVRELIVWLEDQKIRHYAIEDRGDLRQIDSQDWEKTFDKYLTDLLCPLPFSDRKGVCDWILGLAVHLEYGDNSEKYNKVSESLEEAKKAEPQVTYENPLDILDFESSDFKTGVSALAKLMKVEQHPDHLITLRACAKLIKKNCVPEALKNAQNKKGSKPEKEFPLNESPLGFECKDEALNKALKILRLLYIHDVRELQTQINESIVRVQKITANPKTDTRLGKVGY